MEVNCQAFAKLNIFLFVGKKRKDGFHNLVSLVQKTDLFYDDISLCYRESDSTKISILGLEEYVSAKDSTVYKAVEKWLSITGHKAEVSVRIIKGIPVKSGMGGPSSDAASVLLALERCTGNKTPFSKLLSIACEIGSDVPFFLYDCDAAVVSGRGEIVEPIEARTDLEFEVFPGPEKKVGTAQAYENLDAVLKSRDFIPSARDLAYAYRENPKYWTNTNDFEILYTKPCEEAFLTGSGAWWFTCKISK